jgi:hypothetical protein
MQSVLPLHLMHDEGVFGRNIKFVPVLEGFTMPPFFQTLLEVMSMHKVRQSSLATGHSFSVVVVAASTGKPVRWVTLCSTPVRCLLLGGVSCCGG